MLFLWLIEFLVLTFIIVEIGLPLILGIKLFPVIRNIGSRKKLAEINTELEEALTKREISLQEKKLLEREKESNLLGKINPVQKEIDDTEVEQQIQDKRQQLNKMRRNKRKA